MEVHCMSVRLSSAFCNLLLVLFLFAVFISLKIPRKMNVNITQSYSELLRGHPRVTGNRLSRCCGKRDVTNTLFDVETLAKRKKKKKEKWRRVAAEEQWAGTPPAGWCTVGHRWHFTPRTGFFSTSVPWCDALKMTAHVMYGAALTSVSTTSSPFLGVRSHVLLL